MVKRKGKPTRVRMDPLDKIMVPMARHEVEELVDGDGTSDELLDVMRELLGWTYQECPHCGEKTWTKPDGTVVPS